MLREKLKTESNKVKRKHTHKIFLIITVVIWSVINLVLHLKKL
jgi:nitrate reductase NapE component